jgi:hypothetical protein
VFCLCYCMGYLFVEAFCCAPENRFRERMLRFQVVNHYCSYRQYIKIHSSNFLLWYYLLHTKPNYWVVASQEVKVTTLPAIRGEQWSTAIVGWWLLSGCANFICSVEECEIKKGERERSWIICNFDFQSSNLIYHLQNILLCDESLI